MFHKGQYWESVICNYADDTTLFDSGKNLDDTIKNLEPDSLIALTWFEDNYMKFNENKCHFIVSGQKYEHIIWSMIGKSRTWECGNVKLLGINIDKNLNFKDHILSICAKAPKKITVLTRLIRFLNLNQCRKIMKAFIDSQFNYCPLIWMFHSKGLNRAHAAGVHCPPPPLFC